MNKDLNIYSEAVNANLITAIQAMINRSCIIDYGVIKKVRAKGVVDIAVSVADSNEDIKYITCVLANVASSSFTLNVVPNEGDKVLVLYTRKYLPDMFDLSKKDIILDGNARGYNLFSGIAILCNQYKISGHNNVLTIENGTMDLKLAYSENDKKNKVLMSVNADGELHYESNENFSIDIDKNGAVNLKQNKVKIDINKDSEITIDNGKATVKIDKSGNVELNAQGKYTIKNNISDLKSVIDGLAQELENLVTVGSPATQSTSPASKLTIGTWRSSKLNQLLD